MSQEHIHKFLSEPALNQVYEDTMAIIRDERFTISDAGINHRWITHWDKEGLLLTPKAKGKWRKFDLSELFWLRTVVKLRALGVSLPLIKEARDFLAKRISLSDLEESPDMVEQVISTLLCRPDLQGCTREQLEEMVASGEVDVRGFAQSMMENLLFMALVMAEPISILVLPGQLVRPIIWSQFDSNFEEDVQELQQSTFISLSMSELLADVSGLQPSLLRKLKPSLFSQAEWQLLVLLHEGHSKSIEVKMKDGTITSIYATEEVRVDLAKRLTEIFSVGSYQNFKAICQDGSVVYGELTTKHKFK